MGGDRQRLNMFDTRACFETRHRTAALGTPATHLAGPPFHVLRYSIHEARLADAEYQRLQLNFVASAPEGADGAPVKECTMHGALYNIVTSCALQMSAQPSYARRFPLSFILCPSS
jgi:hypothetical protein